jgi:hypothetical protein
MSKEIPNTNEIVAYFHCGLCLRELPEGISPREWQDVEVGWTRIGLQVWCVRHEVNVIHIDFEGIKHRANIIGKRIEDEGIPDAFKDAFEDDE